MPWQPPRPPRGKAFAFVAGLHVLIGTLLITGLGGEPLRRVTDSLAAFDVPLPVPPPDPPPPPQPSRNGAREEAGAPDLEAKPAPVVLPPPPQALPTRNPLPTADETATDTSAAPSAGAAAEPGTGRGAGGSGDGLGGGGMGGSGSGDGAGLGSEARLLSGNLTRRDYRRIREFGSPRGQAVLALEVSANGRLTRCQPLSSSGNPALDELLCQLLARTRWAPARDRGGRPVQVGLRYVASWDRY